MKEKYWHTCFQTSNHKSVMGRLNKDPGTQAIDMLLMDVAAEKVLAIFSQLMLLKTPYQS